MMKKKLAVSIVIAVSAALSLGVGCKKDEDTKAGDSSACEDLCAASSECGDMDDCLSECEDVTEDCPDEVADYLECADGQTDIMCLDVTALGISSSCLVEAAAIQACAIPGGTGGTGGDGDGDGDTGGTTGDGDGDTGGTTSVGGSPDFGGNGGIGGEGGEGGAAN